MTNRLLSRFASQVLQGFPGSFDKRFNARFVGNPVRADIAAIPEPAVRFEGRSPRARLLVFGGMPLLMLEAQSAGELAFSRDAPGHIVALHLPPGEGIVVREHQFLAATDAIDYSFTRLKGVANMLFGGTGFFIDKFHSHKGDGILWLHGYGNVFEKELAAGETIDVEPGGWLYKEPTVRMDTIVDRITSGMFGASFNLIVNRFTGPGKIGIQSMYVHYATET